MVIGILVFNKLVSRDGILDKKLKHRAGYDSTSLLVPAFSFLLLKSCKNIHTVCFELLYIWRFRPPFFCHWKEITGINIKRSDLSRERHGFVFLWQNQSKMKKPHTHAHTLAASVVDNMTVGDFKVELVAQRCLSWCCLYVPQTDEWAAYRINSQVCQMWRCINNCFISNYS